MVDFQVVKAPANDSVVDFEVDSTHGRWLPILDSAQRSSRLQSRLQHPLQFKADSKWSRPSSAEQTTKSKAKETPSESTSSHTFQSTWRWCQIAKVTWRSTWNSTRWTIDKHGKNIHKFGYYLCCCWWLVWTTDFGSAWHNSLVKWRMLTFNVRSAVCTLPLNQISV